MLEEGGDGFPGFDLLSTAPGQAGVPGELVIQGTKPLVCTPVSPACGFQLPSQGLENQSQ